MRRVLAIMILAALAAPAAAQAPRPPWALRDVLESAFAPEWFWERISPHAADGHPGRWEEVLALVEAHGPDAATEARVRQVVRRWWRLMRRSAERHDISMALVAAVVSVESAGNPRAISAKGAGGLMQLMPGTARRLGVRNSLAPVPNLRGGTRYLAALIERFRGDVVLALAAYNSGPLTVERYRGVPPFAETRAYVPAVAQAYLAALAHCVEPVRDIRVACAPDLR